MDAVIKIGGSVLRKDSIKKLGKTLDDLVKEFSFVIVPGGGKFANLVRNYYKNFQISDTTAHWMAIYTENILGFFLLEYLELGQPVFSISEILDVSKLSKIPVFMPFQYLFKQNPLPHSWDVTSDSIAAYLAEAIPAQKLILLKDVDGIFTRDPNQNSSAELKLLEQINLKQYNLSNFHTCVDQYLPHLLKKYKRSCYIANGLYPERLVKILKNQKTIKTIIEV